MQGELTFARIGDWIAQADTLTASATIDLAGVTRIDSAGAAFLLELVRRAARSGRTLNYVNPRQQVLGLLQFLQVDGVLGLDRG